MACRIAENIGYPELPAVAEADEDAGELADGLHTRFNVDLDKLRHEIRQAIWFFESRPPEWPEAEQDEDEPRRESGATMEQPYQA